MDKEREKTITRGLKLFRRASAHLRMSRLHYSPSEVGDVIREGIAQALAEGKWDDLTHFIDYLKGEIRNRKEGGQEK